MGFGRSPSAARGLFSPSCQGAGRIFSPQGVLVLRGKVRISWCFQRFREVWIFSPMG